MTSTNRVPGGVPEGGRFSHRTHTESGLSLPSTKSWPSITYEERPWNSGEADRSLSRRKRLLSRGPYKAAVTPAIADCDPVTDSRTQALTESATLDMVRFDRDLGDDAAPFAALLLRSESASSSEIENLTSGARRIALAQLGDTSSKNARMIASNVLAMRAAIELSEDMSVDNIAAMHVALMRESEPHMAGRFRTEQVWIRGIANSPHGAEFVPPHHEHVPAALDDLARFMRRDDIPALTQAAIAHAQFETIHPFTDGNGRTGRAIVGALLRNKGVTEKVTIPISSGLLTDTRSYFDALGRYREGVIEPIVRRFAESSFDAIDNGRQLAEDIRAAESSYYARFATNPPQSVRHAVSLLVREPAVTADMVAAETGVSTATAYRTVERLVELEILKPAGSVKGSKVWVAPDIVEALDAFAIRAGRRDPNR
ncbi:Fic family protein [Arthrobacter sp. H14]|uniref:Fic family protein n=1 Tax=Arthrobacter sp. H14 TaxID=1312959 RepID=UPI0004AC8456|nr:Fic family protein [Arthrobacter sp. H14]